MSDGSATLNRTGERREQLRGHAAMLLFAALVSGSFSLGARAAPHVDPTALMAARFVVAASVLAGVAIAAVGATAAVAGLRRASWRYVVLGGLYGLYFVMMFEALRVAPPAPLGAVFTLTPLMSAGFAYLFTRRTTAPSVLFALCIGGLGAVWVIFRGDLSAMLGLRIGLGEGLFLIGAIAHAAYTPLVPWLNRGEPIPVFTLGAMVAAALMLGVLGAPSLVATDWASLPPVVWIALVYLGVVTTAGTASLLQFAAFRLPAPKVMAYTYLVPSFVILYEGLIGAGWASALVWPGVIATLLALVLLLRE